MIRVVPMLVFFIFCSAAAELTMSHGMKQVGEPESFRPMALLRFLWKAARNMWIWVALPVSAASFFSLLILLSWAPISVVIPASASNFIVGTLGAKYLLKEQVSAKRWMGALLVFVGVTLVLLTGKQ
jgi:drug/metabolite transporter (DMT)-like permease